jgi:hypothetical protein
MHVAGGTRVRKVYGIEINDLSAGYAVQYASEFEKWLKW